MSQDIERFAALLHRSAALWRVKLDERLRPWGMTQAAWRTLWLLRAAEERFNQSQLALRLGIETPTLVRILDRMEKRELIRREADSQDRRQKYLALTAAGLALVEEIDAVVQDTRRRMLAGLADEELRAGIALFEKILDNAGAPAPD